MRTAVDFKRQIHRILNDRNFFDRLADTLFPDQLAAVEQPVRLDLLPESIIEKQRDGVIDRKFSTCREERCDQRGWVLFLPARCGFLQLDAGGFRRGSAQSRERCKLPPKA